MTYSSRRDANEPALIELWRSLGCLVVQMDRIAGFDLIVLCPRTGFHIVEVKDGSKKWTTTDREEEMIAAVQAVGGNYWIVTSEAEALAMVTPPEAEAA